MQNLYAVVTKKHPPHPRRVTGLGVGVHLTRLTSLPFAAGPALSHPAARPIASARRDAAVPIVVRLSRRCAAGVSEPGASARRGVPIAGGPISPRGVRRGVVPASRFARSRRLLDARAARRCESASLALGAESWKGVAPPVAGASSSSWEMMRGVPSSVPVVISCRTADGPSSEGVGDGKAGTKEKELTVGDLGRSVRSVKVVRDA
jgi:hypothetical protein